MIRRTDSADSAAASGSSDSSTSSALVTLKATKKIAVNASVKWYATWMDTRPKACRRKVASTVPAAVYVTRTLRLCQRVSFIEPSHIAMAAYPIETNATN